MRIQIIAVTKIDSVTKGGKGYVQLEVAYKNLTFQGKVESKKIMPFGDTAPTHKALMNANNGDVFEIEVRKNAAGYNDFVSATPSSAEAPSSPPASQAPGRYQGNNQGTGSPAPASRGFETPEERAKRQVYIVRQSSLSTAATVLSVGSKTAPSVDAVIEAAKQFEKYVFGVEEAKDVEANPTGFDDMSDDIPY